MQITADLFMPGVPILEKMIRPIIVYVFLITVLRVAGKRELAQINTFDLVVLLTLSNTVQNAIIGNDNSLLGGLIGATTLIAVNALTVRFLYGHPLLSRLMEGTPTPLVKHGKVIHERLKREGITLPELTAAAHRQGFASLSDVEKATLEPSGAISCIGKQPSEEHIRHQEMLDRIDRLTEELHALQQAIKPEAN